MKKFLVIIFILGSNIGAYSQKNDTEYTGFNQDKIDQFHSKNSLGIDIGYFHYIFIDGTSTILNYERSLHQNLKVRIGCGYFAIGESYRFTGLQFPVTFNYLSGVKNNHFELDVGGRLSYMKGTLNKYVFPNDYMVSLVFNLGYRYQQPTGGIIFKALVGIDGVTLGVGYAF